MRLPFRVTSANLFPLLGFAGTEALRTAWGKVRGAPPRSERALARVRERARRGDPESVLAVLDEFGRREAFLMNVGDRKGLILDREVQRTAAVHALEIGAFCGYSAVRMGRLLASRGGRLISIEASPDYAEVARQVVEFAGLSATVDFRVGKAEHVLPELEGGQPFDLVFIDHWKDLYLPDLRRIEALGLLHPGSVVVADNIGLFDSRAYLDHVRSSGLYDSVNHPSTVEYRDSIPDAVEVSTWRGGASA
jgi:catechol O-methyltransferase